MRVGFVQVNMGLSWSSHGDDGPRQFALLPYSVGLLEAHARRYAREAHEYALPVFGRLRAADAARQLAGCDVVAFSTYVWNEQLSLEIAGALKSTDPDTLVVFGGPQVPDRAEEWLRRHPDVDVACHGEGEAVFTEILDHAEDRSWDGIGSVSYVDADGRFVHHPKRPRLLDLDVVPSPYLSGVFDPLMAAHPDHGWVMMWETNRGCPFSCTFCDWGSATAAKVLRFDMDRLLAEIDWMADNRIGFVFCCDANFGMLPRDLDIAEAVVAAKERSGYPFSLSVQNAKNATERAYKVQNLIASSLNTLGVTISLQSANEQTLANIKRSNISSASFETLQRRFASDGVYTYTDLILALPGESYDQFADGVSHVVRRGQHNHIQFHNCAVLPNAEMGDPEYRRRYGTRCVRQRMLNVHDEIDLDVGPTEWLDIVVATDALPAADWVREKVFSWLTDLCYFDRLIQVPLLLAGARHDVPLRAFIEAIAEAAPARAPTIATLVADLASRAADIQNGADEYLSWGGRWWPADQHALISLVAGGSIGRFYDEVEPIIAGVVAAHGADEPALIISDALELNRALLRLPLVTNDLTLVQSHRIWDAYVAALRGEPAEIIEELAMYRVDRTTKRWDSLESWCEHLVWSHGKDKRGYLGLATPLRRSRVPAAT